MAKPPIPVQDALTHRNSTQACEVDSSAIAAASYNDENGRLIVTFKGGRTYAYLNVSPQRFAAFCSANSKGQYLNSQIKGKYAYRRMG